MIPSRTSGVPWNTACLTTLIFLLFASTASAAEDITMTVNQSEYYFLTGQDGIFDIMIANGYSKEIPGIISYTITQEVNQAGFHYSSSNSNSQQYTVQKEDTMLPISIGTSDNPITAAVKLEFDYDENGKPFSVSLDEILIHFVSNNSQMQQNSQQRSSSSQESQQSSSQQQAQQSAQQQKEEQRSYSSQQSATQQKANALQQNMNQDMDSLKSSMTEENKKRQETEERLADNIENNKQFREMQQELQDMGYELDQKQIDPSESSADDGEFNYQYSKENGDTAEIKGSIKNSTIKDMTMQNSEELTQAKKDLLDNKEFRQMKDDLENRGYNMSEPQIRIANNTAYAKTEFTDNDNNTAVIEAEIMNNTVTSIKLIEDRKRYLAWIPLIFAALLLFAATAYFLKKKKKKKNVRTTSTPEKKPETINFRKEALNMIEKAKKLFSENRKKEAYMMASRGIRFYHTRRLDISDEITKDELIKVLRERKEDYQQTNSCLELCNLVSFAKYKPNRNDFDRIIKDAIRIIQKKL